MPSSGLLAHAGEVPVVVRAVRILARAVVLDGAVSLDPHLARALAVMQVREDLRVGNSILQREA